MAWAEVQGSGKAAKAVGGRCQSCSHLHGLAFRYLDWSGFCKLHETEDLYLKTNMMAHLLDEISEADLSFDKTSPTDHLEENPSLPPTALGCVVTLESCRA